jgi:hypothetical protein
MTKLFTHKSYKAILSSLIVNSFLLLSPLSSIAYEERSREVLYGSCAQLQQRLNYRNSPTITFKGFERAEMRRRTFAEEARAVYCNGGVIVDRAERTICRGYIAYSYHPSVGTATYYGDWGWTNGLPNDADTGKERYCRRLK